MKALPLVMAASQKCKNMGMSLNQDEMGMIIDSLKASATPAERKRIDMMVNMMNIMKN